MPEQDFVLYQQYFAQFGTPQQRNEWLLQHGAFQTVSAWGGKFNFSDFAFPLDRAAIGDDTTEDRESDDDNEEYDIADDPYFQDFNPI